jgi:two-component system response regulator
MENKKILLVEDNPDDVELTLRAFRKVNLANDVDVVSDGEEALKYLDGHKEVLPVVVLLDLKLPKVEGLEVLKRLRADEATRLLPVVIMTSSREERDLIDGYRFGANSYIRKPVNFEQFVDAVRQLGVYWLLLNEPPPLRKV